MVVVQREGPVQLSLLDRLTDPTPGVPGDRSPPAFSFSRLRDSVIRDLSFLFNTTQLSSAEALPLEVVDSAASGRLLAQQTTINYGIPGLIGMTNAQGKQIERVLARAIADFEPRLVDVRVRFVKEEDDAQTTARPRTMSFTIEAKLAWGGAREAISLRTELDPYAGDMTVSAV